MPHPASEAEEVMQQLLAAARLASPGTVPSFRVGGYLLSPAQVVEALTPFLSERRRARIEEVLDHRTYNVATVVEGLVNTGNVSAVMRSAEALGYQGFHIVAGTAPLKHSPRTTQGADKWLDVHAWPSPTACVEALKARGYQIVVTHLDETAVPIETLDFTQRTALVFGNELNGVSEEMLALADRRCVVPMIGFTQSFNISVAAAVSLYHAYQDRLGRQGHHGDLTDTERITLRATFYLRGARNGTRLLQEAVSRQDG